jgi:hypothetical protein
MASPVSLSEQGQPLPPIVREVIPLQSSLELVFLLVSFLGLLLASVGVALAKGILGSKPPASLRLSGRSEKPSEDLVATQGRRLSDSAPGYDVIHDATYLLRRIQEADESSRKS